MRDLLAEVSRSFFLSLRILPRGVRSPISLAYLLARASDTLADCGGPGPDRRIAWLDGFLDSLESGSFGDWHEEAAGALLDHPHEGERQLIERLPECLDWLADLPASQVRSIRSVIATIVSGQKLDVQRFCRVTGHLAEVIGGEEELDDYTWRVAGCVGRFWSEIGFDVFGDRFATLGRDEMDALGIEFGKGLQLVNVLRDLPTDLTAGRCYLPVSDPRDRRELMAAHHEWTERAVEKVRAGLDYGRAVRSRRLRAATVLPCLLAEDTLALLRGITWERLVERPKVRRGRVYQDLWRAWWWTG